MASSTTETLYIIACHCKRTTLTLPSKPTKINECHCTVCYSYGALWAYYTRKDVTISFPEEVVEKYIREDKGKEADIAFHRCAKCGNMLYWAGLGEYSGEDHMIGVNMRMVPKKELDGVEWKVSRGPNEEGKKEDLVEGK